VTVPISGTAKSTLAGTRMDTGDYDFKSYQAMFMRAPEGSKMTICGLLGRPKTRFFGVTRTFSVAQEEGVEIVPLCRENIAIFNQKILFMTYFIYYILPLSPS
jgi:hypothetical protein